MFNNKEKWNTPIKNMLNNDKSTNVHCLDRAKKWWCESSKQARHMSEYWTMCKILATALLACPVFALAVVPGPSGLYAPGAGFVWSGQFSATINSLPTESTTSPYNISVPIVGSISFSNLSGQTVYACYQPSNFGWSSDRVAYGYLVAEDVILAITEGTISGGYAHSIYSSGDNPNQTTRSGSWSSDGNLITDGDTYNPWCLSSRASERYLWLTPYAQNTSSTSGKISLYIGPKAAPKKYSSINLWFYRTFTTNSQQLIASSSFSVAKISSCTIGLEGQSVNFGVVSQSASDSQILGVFPSQLNINCEGVGSVPMSLSFTGSQGRYTDTLALDGTEGQGTLAEIRGVRAVGAGYCDNNADSIQFQGQQVSIGNVGVGLTSVPLTWSLCSNGSGGMGVGTSQAIVTLTWP